MKSAKERRADSRGMALRFAIVTALFMLVTHALIGRAPEGGPMPVQDGGGLP